MFLLNHYMLATTHVTGQYGPPPKHHPTTPPPLTVFVPNHHLKLWYYEKHMIIVSYQKSAESRAVTNRDVYYFSIRQELKKQHSKVGLLLPDK